MKQRLVFVIGIVAMLAFFSRCAQVGSITGGLKDTVPPVFLVSKPANYSVGFQDDRVVVSFDEYFTIKDQSKKFIASPPFKHRAEIKIKGKNLIVEILDTLKENTTYTLDFGDAIQDLNESNPIDRFTYVFSTGNQLDSLAILGRALNAFDHKPVEGALVMLYQQFNDSLPRTTLPQYITKTNKDGNFSVVNIANGQYYIVALEDANNNKLFDQPSERFAFLDTALTTAAHLEHRMDTIQIFRIKINSDTLRYDSLYEHDVLVHTPNNIVLPMFAEDKRKQYLDAFERIQASFCRFTFNAPTTDSLRISGVGFALDSLNSLFEISQQRDTIGLWLIDSAQIKTDTLLFRLDYLKTDSMNELSPFSDTLKLVFAAKPTGGGNKPKRKSKKERMLDEIEVDTLRYMAFSSNAQGTLDLGADVVFKFDNPTMSWDTGHLQLIYMRDDTLEVPITDYQILQDSGQYHRIKLRYPFEERNRYLLIADKHTFTDVFGLPNDSVGSSFRMQRKDHYGNIDLKMKGWNPKGQLILQLLSEKEKLIRQLAITQDGKYKLPLVPPGKYMLKVIEDDNLNGLWDTGNYKALRQAEVVRYYKRKELIEVRSNWDNKLEWLWEQEAGTEVKEP